MERTPLHYAASKGHLECVKVLLKYGADKNAQTRGGDTPIMKAAELGYLDIIKELINWGCDFRISNKVRAYNKKQLERTANDVLKAHGVDYLESLVIDKMTQRISGQLLIVYLHRMGKNPFNKISLDCIYNICKYI